MGYVRDKQGGEGAASQRGLKELRTSRQLQSNWAGSFSRSRNTENSVESHTGDLRGTTAFLWSRNQLFTVTVLIMRSVCVCFCLALLLPWRVQSQRSLPTLTRLDEDTQRDVLAFDVLNRSGVLNSLLRSEHHLVLRRARPPRPASQVPKRAQQGSRFALSLDVPTSILSVLIDLAKNQDMRTKAAANAELMARIGKRK